MAAFNESDAIEGLCPIDEAYLYGTYLFLDETDNTRIQRNNVVLEKRLNNEKEANRKLNKKLVKYEIEMERLTALPKTLRFSGEREEDVKPKRIVGGGRYAKNVRMRP